uniref:Uncharacterized protein n=1 Tax=Oryza meridionalis TaxID=40149 RepID=A0A0E0DSH2_9ORYZ
MGTAMPVYNALARDATLRRSASTVPTFPATMSNPNTTPWSCRRRSQRRTDEGVYRRDLQCSPSSFNAAVTAICIAPCTQKHVNHGGARQVHAHDRHARLRHPDDEQRKKWTEVINQFLNALVTITCLYQQSSTLRSSTTSCCSSGGAPALATTTRRSARFTARTARHGRTTARTCSSW